jgi:hypothetical protein
VLSHDHSQPVRAASSLAALEQLLADVEAQISSDEEEFGEFGATYCLEVEDLDGSALHILYRLDNGDPQTFELTAAYHDGRRLHGSSAELAASIGRAVVAAETMEEFLFG